MNATEFLSKQVLHDYLLRIHENTPAVWGKMNAIQMLEHLGLSLAYSSNKKGVLPVLTPPEKIERYKQFLYSDQELQHNVSSPLQGDTPPLPHSANLHDAVEYLFDEMNDFHAYFQQFPEQKTVHHIFGMLDYEEWKAFHKKHFVHHFKQFGL
jgi:hydroxymethylglutaryl-CoA reductase